LPQVKLSVTAAATKNEQSNGGLRVMVNNPSTSVAFMAHLRLTQGQGGADVVPVFWEENYFSLLPGESREVAVSYPIRSLEGKAAVVEVDGYNVSPVRVTP
jgi:exo-1,4-beta-D-glucosaminidase